MKKSVKIAIAFATLAGIAGTAALANERHGSRHMRGDDGGQMGMMFENADADKSGDVSFEEFSAAMNGRMGIADADKDGKLTVGEIADAIVRQRAETMAKRMISRFDTNGDGELTTQEIEGRQKKIFAMMDNNDDGKIAKDEMQQRGMMRGPGKDHHGWRMGGWRHNHDGMGPGRHMDQMMDDESGNDTQQ